MKEKRYLKQDCKTDVNPTSPVCPFIALPSELLSGLPFHSPEEIVAFCNKTSWGYWGFSSGVSYSLL